MTLWPLVPITPTAKTNWVGKVFYNESSHIRALWMAYVCDLMFEFCRHSGKKHWNCFWGVLLVCVFPNVHWEWEWVLTCSGGDSVRRVGQAWRHKHVRSGDCEIKKRIILVTCHVHSIYQLRGQSLQSVVWKTFNESGLRKQSCSQKQVCLPQENLWLEKHLRTHHTRPES